MISGRRTLIIGGVAGADISPVYTNSMLASLNARKKHRTMQAAPNSEPLVFLRALENDSARKRILTFTPSTLTNRLSARLILRATPSWRRARNGSTRLANDH
jgi:hypothetical protein